MGMRAFIDDGYTRQVGIREDAGLHPAVEWLYRPLRGPEASNAYVSFAKAQDPEAAKLAFICDRIEAWRFADSEDAPSDFTKPEVDQLRRLNGVAYTRIETIVMGTGKPDYEVLPGPVEEIVNEPKADVEQAVDDAKNSPTGSPF